MKTIKKTVLILIAIFSIGTISAQDEGAMEKKFTLSGSVDAYYQANLSAADNDEQSFGTSFADELGFALGMANIAL